MKHTITTLLLFLLLTMGCAAKAQQWKELHTGVSEDLYDVCCIDTNKVFVCGRNGLILKTEDGGNSWQEKYRQEGCDWYSIKFLDSDIGFVLGDDDNSYDNNYKLLKTTNGGETWFELGSPFNAHNNLPYSCDLFIVDADTLYVACDQLMKSTDGGDSFFQLEVDRLHITRNLYFEGNVGYIVWGMPGDFQGTHIAKTLNYGFSWEEILSFNLNEEGIKKALFHDKDHVSIYGAFGYNENEFYYEYDEIRTDDGFTTYRRLQNENLPIGLEPQISGVCFSDLLHGVIAYDVKEFAYTGVVSYQTEDGGNTWHELEALSGPISRSAAISGCMDVYYLAFGNGHVYKMGKTYSGILENEHVFVFPNPASDVLFVYGKENCDMIIYDASGREMLRQKMKCKNLIVDIGVFPSGLYNVVIKDKNSVSCQKVIKK